MAAGQGHDAGSACRMPGLAPVPGVDRGRGPDLRDGPADPSVRRIRKPSGGQFPRRTGSPRHRGRSGGAVGLLQGGFRARCRQRWRTPLPGSWAGRTRRRTGWGAGNVLISRDLGRQFWQNRRIPDVAAGDLGRPDFRRFLINPEVDLAPVVAAVQAMRGVGFTVAGTVGAGVGDFRRFDTLGQPMASLGLTPPEHSGGASVRRGGIIRAGSGLARRALIGGVRRDSMQARVSPKLFARIEALPQAVRDIA